MDVHNAFANQAATLLLAVLLGAGLCLLFDALRILRLACRVSVLSVALQDFAFWLVCALLTFGLLMVRCRGELRGYVLACEICGFFLCRRTVSVALMKTAGAIIHFFRAVAECVRRVFVRPVRRAARGGEDLLRRAAVGSGRAARKSAKKIWPFAQKHLKPRRRAVYNEKSEERAGSAERLGSHSTGKTEVGTWRRGRRKNRGL